MPLNIKDEEVDRLARQLARRTGETITDAVRAALKERLQRLRTAKEAPLSERIMAIARRLSEHKPLTDKSGKELMDELYDEHGLPR